MEFEIIEYPWKHIIIDDFLDDFAFETLKNVKEEDYINKLGYMNEKRRRGSDTIHFGASITDEGIEDANTNPMRDLFSDSFIQYIYDNYLDKLEEIYLALTGEVIEDPKMYLEWRAIQNGFKSTRHVDIPRKKLSIVVYLSEEGDGTELYLNDKDKEPVVTIPWKQNRAFIFAREEEITWHSFKCDNPKVTRLTFGFNLASKSHKGIF